MISTRSMALIGTSSGPSQLPAVGRKATEWPSIITFRLPLSPHSPPEIPRTEALGMAWSSVM